MITIIASKYYHGRYTIINIHNHIMAVHTVVLGYPFRSDQQS